MPAPTSPRQVCAIVLCSALAAACFVLLMDRWNFPRRSGGGGSGGRDGWKKPGFCGRMDCPEYTVWQKHPDFQIREYKEAYWVAMNVTAHQYELAVHMATPLLIDYIDGANNASLRLEETVPLTVHYRTDLDPHAGEPRNYTVGLFIPYEHQDAPPAPNSTDLWVYRNPEAALAVRMFPHRPLEWRVMEEYRALIDALYHAGHEDFEPGEVLVASYEHVKKRRPTRRHYRHSEVWMRGDFKEPDTGGSAA